MEARFTHALTGARTGRTWRWNFQRDAVHTSRWRATAADDGSFALVHWCVKDGMWEDDVDHVRHSLYVASIPAITEAPTIRRLLDYEETLTVPSEFGPLNGHLAVAWEWAECSLHDFLHEPAADARTAADQVEENVGAALGVLHQIGLIHCDVAPNNVMRVGGRWKLADLDACRLRGLPADRLPLNEHYLHPERREAVSPPAREEFDKYGLDRILERLRQ